MEKQEMLDILQVEESELTKCEIGDYSIFIEGSSSMGDGHYIIYGGPDWRCLGPYQNEQQAAFTLTGAVIAGLFESYDDEDLNDYYESCFGRTLERASEDTFLEHTDEGIKQVTYDVVIQRLYEYYT